ncbi:MAG: outer membrane beta-barrel protein [Paracoccaceae bacterium]|nr:outer membrane beta-barrel protein [Paracoccaceae bacterium]
MKSVFKASIAATALSLFSTTSVLADGPQAPIVLPPVAPPITDWTGPYAGLLLSYNDGDFGNGNFFPGDGEGELSGYGYGLVLGYNFQSGNIVYGGEVTWSGLNVDGAEDCANPIFECGVEVENVATIRGRIGIAAGAKSLVYATAGWAAADVHAYTDDDGFFGVGRNGETKRLNGYVFGVGFEHAFNERFSVRAAILRHNFNEDDFQTDIRYNDIDVDFTTIEIGGIYRF